MSQNSLKNSFEKVFFQILAKIEIMRNKNQLFGRHFETVQHFIYLSIFFFFFFFCQIMIFYSAYIYGANFIATFRWESGFLRLGSRTPPPPWAQTGVKVPWSLKC